MKPGLIAGTFVEFKVCFEDVLLRLSSHSCFLFCFQKVELVIKCNTEKCIQSVLLLFTVQSIQYPEDKCRVDGKLLWHSVCTGCCMEMYQERAVWTCSL